MKMNTFCAVVFAVSIGVQAAAEDAVSAKARSWTMVNPTGREYSNELVRLRIDLPGNLAPGRCIVKEDGKEVPCQIEEIGGRRQAWVCTTLGKGQTHTYAVEEGKPARFEPKVKVSKRSGVFEMDNGLIGVRVPQDAGKGVPCPVLEVRMPNGKWVGEAAWHTSRRLTNFAASVVCDGAIFGKVRLRYDFEGKGGVLDEDPAHFQVDVSLCPGRNHIVLEESFAMGRFDWWEFDAAQRWKPRQALTIPHFGGFDRADILDSQGKPFPFPPESLKVGQTRMGDTLLNLIPRWSQAYDDGWFFMAHDGENAVGALVCRAGKWLWPHDSMIEIKAKESADYAGFRCPTWRGKRYWYLTVGPRETWVDPARCAEYVNRHSFETLDKIHSEYVLDWPGLEPPLGKDGKPVAAPEEYTSGAGRFGPRSRPFFGWGPAGAGMGGDHPITTLIRAQLYCDPDTFGNYWLFFSPENPNFATAWTGPIFGEAAKCKGHPRFKDLAKLVEMKLREEYYHSITVPGGAGQECPGYMFIDHWRGRANSCKENFGFDAMQWPQMRVAGGFHLHLSFPLADGSRRCHPGGDTHPHGPDVFKVAANFGVKDNPATFVTEELPGFGVVFRNKPSTPQETYLAFKSGPNRGHYHGDQLSFHYCAYARLQLPDHHCSYGPRAGQEHMHNRVAFHTEKLPWANMDGFERVIALKTTPDVDVAMGQVESERLRITEKFPPEKWDTSLPQEIFDTPLKYRRTIVFLKNKGRDFFVIRDQHVGPEVFSTYCLHAYGDKCEQQENFFNFDALTVFVAAPAKYEVSQHDWQHKNGGLEVTKGLRLTTKGRSSEFITVLMPRPVPSVSAVRFVLEGALVKGDGTKSDLPMVAEQEKDRFVGEKCRFSRTPAYSQGEHSGKVTVSEAEGKIRLDVNVAVGGDRWVKGGKGEYAVEIARDGSGYKGSFTGTFVVNPEAGKGAVTNQAAGQVSGELLKEWYPTKAEYSQEPNPSMVAVPGGVKIGDDEVVFSGGVDKQDDMVYVTVRRGGKEAMTLTGRDIDMDRSQGEIGLFVPDAGYPFGVIPDWLIKQRAKRPDWYVEMWPLTEHSAAGR